MSSIMTNAAALTALQSLNNTNKQLETTQARISTGYRVATASDNAAYWSIAPSMKSDNKALSAVQDSLGLGAGKVDTAYTALEKTVDIVNQIKDKLVAHVDRLRYLGIFHEVWSRLDGSRIAVYQNANEAKEGLFSAIAVLDVDDPASFLREMKTRFPEATAKTPLPPEASRPDPSSTGSLPEIVGLKRIEARR